MSKSTTKQKRPPGKNSPLSKRPKLDFTLTTRGSFKENNEIGKESPNVCRNTVKEKSTGNPTGDEREREQNLPSSDWDDDFSGDMLEKVFLIADASQAVANNESVPEPENEEIKKRDSPKPRPFLLTTVETLEPYEKLKLDLQGLQEKLKTKEGEVHFLRSQLKQNEDAKQAAALQNIKAMEEIQAKFNDKLSLTEKELENTKSKLLFKDLEYKTLSERCRQLEYTVSKSKVVAEIQSSIKPLNCFSQVTHSAQQSKETCVDKHLNSNDNSMNNGHFKFEYFTFVQHEGKNLAKILCPEFFRFTNEPSVVPFYAHCSETESHKNHVDKVEKYKWGDLPKPTAHLKDIYKDVCSLFICESFTQKKVTAIIQTILNACEEILHHQNEIFKFLDKLQLRNIEYEKADRFLLEKEEEVELVTVKSLLNCTRLNEEECGLESRRCLGLMYSLVEVSKTAFDMVKSNVGFVKSFKDIVASIGKLRRPLRYTGVLVGISFVLQKLLQEKSLSKEFESLIIETVEEMIFARPKLDVLREIINVLAAGKHHMGLLAALCRRESVDSCMLYMDCKLRQAMFFTKNACPLKLLCMQIMGLACLPCSQSIRWDVTECVIKWLNSSLSAQNSKNLKWLPVCPSFMEEDRCFNVTECLLYLLVLCLNDYNLHFPAQGSFDDITAMKKPELEKKNYLISIIGQGAVLFKRILKADQRQLHENSYSLRFSVLLKGLVPNKSSQCQVSCESLSPVEMEAISWINDLLETNLRAQDCSLKQNVSTLPDDQVFNTLKINDETAIF